jgi:MFS family permease
MVKKKKGEKPLPGLIEISENQEQPSLGEVLKNKSYSLVISGQILAVVSNIIAFTAISYIIYSTTQSATMMSLLIVIGILPNVLLMPIAGVLIDRLDQRKVIFVATTILLGATLGFLTIYLLKDLLTLIDIQKIITGTGHIIYQSSLNYVHFIWPLYLLAFINAIGGSVLFLTIGTYTRHVVKRKNLLVMNSFNQTVMQIATVIGPLIAGVIADFDYLFSFIISGAVIGAGATVCFFLTLKGNKPILEDRKRKHWKEEILEFGRDIRIGFRAVREDSKISFVLVIYTLFNFTVASIGGLYSVILQGKLELNPTWYGTVGTVSAGIGILTSLIIITIGKINRKLLLINIVILIEAVGLLLFSLITNKWVMVLVVTLPLGIVNGAANIPSNTLRQERLPKEKLGRAMSTVTLFTSLGNLTGTIIVTIVSGIFLPTHILLVGTGLTFLLGIGGTIAMFSKPSLRCPDYKKEEAMGKTEETKLKANSG